MKIGSMKVNTTLAVLAVIGSVCLTLSSGARAEQPCRPEAQKLCNGVQPGGGRIMACLKQHESELSPQCQKLVAQSKPTNAAIVPK